MPTYDYACSACGHRFEEFQSITADALVKCPACKKKKLERLIGGGAGVIFKGSGFYQTDYRSESYKSAAKADQDTSAAKPAADTTSTTGKADSASTTPPKSEAKSKKSKD